MIWDQAYGLERAPSRQSSALASFEYHSQARSFLGRQYDLSHDGGHPLYYSKAHLLQPGNKAVAQATGGPSIDN